MTQTSIGIIGGGIVGATAAYYLSRQGYQVTLYEEGTGQATKASAGIICPWFSLRRNKPWYYLVSNGAEHYRQMMADLEIDGFDTSQMFQIDGALLIRKNEMSLARDIERGTFKRIEAPAIGHLETVRTDHLKTYFPLLESNYDATFVEGGGRVNGRALIATLHQALEHFGGTIIRERAHLVQQAHMSHQVQIATETRPAQAYEKILLAAGAWLPHLLEPLGYQVDIRPQKGQLFSVFDTEWTNQGWPVVMPPGKFDIIPFNNGEIVIGASHENDKGYDLTEDTVQLDLLYQKALPLFPDIKDRPFYRTEVGTRAYTSDYTVLLGKVPLLDQIWAVSGLGSSGLTSGPFIGYQWAKLVNTGQWDINEDDFPIHHYIQSVK